MSVFRILSPSSIANALIVVDLYVTVVLVARKD